MVGGEAMEKVVITNKNGESITLGNHPPYFLEILDGASEIPVTVESQKSPKQDGSTYLDNTLENRAISIEGMIVTKNNPREILECRRKMQKVLNPKLGLVIINYQNKEIKAIVESTPIFPSGQGNKGLYYQKYLIYLLCHQPFWKDTGATKEEAAIWRGLFEFPLEVLMDTGIEMGFREPSLIVNIYNPGDISCGMEIKFKALATVVNPMLYNVNTREYIKINKTLVSGEILTVTTHFSNKRIESYKDGVTTNAFNWIDLDSTFLQLEPKDNLLRYDADDGLDNLEIDIYYNPEYLGV